MNKKIKIAACVMVAGLGLSSCSMDLLPLNEVVLENYWTNEEDVQSVVNSCYNAMQSQSYIQSIMVWGECRSDNTTPTSAADKNLRDLMQGNLKTTNPWCDWGPFYTVINRCNTVLHYAPEVAAKDPNFTESEFMITQAEVKFMRAYSYLTLIKTFKDVPFTFEASIDDTQDYRIGQTSFETILNTLIEDIEGCKNYPPIKYSTGIDNTARVTRLAMYALLAEMYLWRASNASADISSQQSDYRACIACCDYIINAKINQYKEGVFRDKDDKNINIDEYVDRTNVYKNYQIPLLKEEGGRSNGPAGFNAIFAEGNSFESIFEVTFMRGTDINYAISMYGGYADEKANSTTQYVYADESIITTAPVSSATYNNSSLFPVPSDYRAIENFYFADGAGSQYIYKYVLSQNMAGVNTTGGYVYGAVSSSTGFVVPSQSQASNTPLKDYQCPNWIIYRLTEVILFRAEAEIALAGTMPVSPDSNTEKPEEYSGPYRNGADLGTSEELYSDAFNLIKAVYWRSNPSVNDVSSEMLPKRESFTQHSDYVDLLLQERRREFLFEGKRYYDLVRTARRNGNTEVFMDALNTKYGTASKAIRIKMANLDFMYMPVLKSQIKLNPNLVQNSQYYEEEESVKN